MAMTQSFQCCVITPERQVLECEAQFVAFPAHDGEMGMLVNRAPLVCKLGIGVLRVEESGRKHHYFVDGGFAQVVENRLTILTEQALRDDELSGDSAQRAMIEATAMKITDDESFETRSAAMARAQVQLKLTHR
jgi:F-type H+-transporting ATPase subunit epsilon